jgi:hypothetical protein
MPGAQALVHQANDPPVAIDQIMRADLGQRIAQPRQRVIRGLHAGVMQDQTIDGAPVRPLIGIGRRMLADRENHRPQLSIKSRLAALLPRKVKPRGTAPRSGGGGVPGSRARPPGASAGRRGGVALP